MRSAVVLLAVAALLGPAPLTAADDLCATQEQTQKIRQFLAENPGMLPAIATRSLKLPEAVIASGLPAEQAVGTSKDGFAKVWESITSWTEATTMIIKDGSVFEVQGPLPPGEPSTRSKYFNLGTHQGAGLGGHVRPDLLSSIYPIAVAGEGGAATRGVVFHGPSGESVFSVYVSAEGSQPSAEDLVKFEATMALIKSVPRVCGGS